jgi:hypothetical protein
MKNALAAAAGNIKSAAWPSEGRGEVHPYPVFAQAILLSPGNFPVSAVTISCGM